jgi:nitrate/nitrite transporter NarK
MEAEVTANAGLCAPRYRWWALLLSAIVMAFVAGAAWTIMPVLFHEISQPGPVGLGLSLKELGAIWGMLPLASAFFCIPMGIMADRYGVRWLIGLGIILAALAGACRGMSGGFTSLLVWMFLFGVGYSTILPNLPKFMGTWFPPDKLGMSNGITLGGFGLGSGLAIQFGGSLLSPAVGGWRNTLWIFGVITAGIGILWLITARDRNVEGLAPGSHRGEAAAHQGLFQSLTVAIGTLDVWLLMGAQVGYFMGYMGAIGYLPMYLVGKGLSQATAHGYISILLYVYVAGAIVVPMISDRLGTRKWVYFVSIALNGLAVMATAFVTGPALAAAFIIWGASSGGIILAYVVPLEHPRIGPALAGGTIGLLVATGFTGGFVSPIMGNAIAERMGGATAIVLWGGCYVAAAFIFLLVRETHPGRAKV